MCGISKYPRKKTVQSNCITVLSTFEYYTLYIITFNVWKKGVRYGKKDVHCEAFLKLYKSLANKKVHMILLKKYTLQEVYPNNSVNNL